MGSFQLGNWSGCRRLGSPLGFAPVSKRLWLARVICKHIYFESIGNQLTEVKKKKGWGEEIIIRASFAKCFGICVTGKKKKKNRIIEAR